MIANANDDGANGGPEGLALWVAERCAGGVRRRLCVLRGPLRFGISSAALPPELWARCRPFDDPGDGVAAEKEGA